ncbi:MAG TPA: class I SAM-dependent methyltransferase [Pedobacter sp.]|nr:class I SAM-dependent methyltransferase [Pedobacter sp.]
MGEQQNEEQLMETARQLSCPSGAYGITTAGNMAVHNSNMISVTISTLKSEDKDRILEIGPGGGSHVPEVLHQASALLYYGVDISELMVAESSKFNKELVTSGRATFNLSDGETLDFVDDFFNRVFTVNTLYFWKDPDAFAAEILRVLKPGGTLCVAFAPRSFMEQLPFTKYTFRLYSAEEAKELFQRKGFVLKELDIHQEVVQVNPELSINREFIVLTLQKPV